MTMTEDRPQLVEQAAGTLTTQARRINRIVKAVGVAASTDSTRPALQQMRVRISAGKATIDATNSYQLHRAEVHFRSDEFDPKGNLDVLVPAKWLIAATVGNGLITITFANGRCTVTNDDETRSTALYTHPYPDVDGMLDRYATIESEDKAAVDPKKLVLSLQAATTFNNQWSVRPLHVKALNPIKPCLFVQAGDDKDSLTLLLMPVRVP